MPYIKRAFDGQFTEIPLALYDPSEPLPGVSRPAASKRWTKAIIYPVKNSAGQVREVVLMFEDLTAWLLENTSDIIYSHDLEGNCLSINSAGEKITGYSLEELKKMNIAQIIAPEHLELAKQMIERKSHHNTPTVYELDIITKDGRRLTLEINTRISLNQGQPLAVEGIARNITARKQTEEALRVSEARYRSLLENANDIIYSHDLLGNYVAVNGAAEKITGYSLEELKRMNIAEFIVPEHHERIKQVIEKKLHDPTPSVHEFDIIRKDGHRRTLEVNPKISAIEGEPLAIEGVARDITERKEAEEKLRESEERFRRAFAIETVGVIFFKTDGQITDSNDAFLKMSGYDREDCQRGLLRWDEMTAPEFMPRSLYAIQEFLTLGRVSPYEKQYIRKDGSRWWALFAATRINAGEGVEFIIDITERKQTEELLRESEERLRLATEAARMYSWEMNLTTQEVKYSQYSGAAFNSDSLPKNLEEVMKKIHPEDRQQVLREVERAVSGTGTFTQQYRIVNPGEEITWYESFAVTVHNVQGNSGSLIGITQDITERKQAEELRQTWAERLEAAREDERRRLSLQLHDDIVQQLAVASIKLQRLEKKLIQLLPEENAMISDLVITQELLHRNQKSLRHMAHVLHSGVLEQFGLIEAFRKFKRNIDTLLKEHSINFSLDLAPKFPRLEPIVEIGIYRTVQEAIVNALKHSHAELISLRLGIKDESALVVITDDGCGFDTNKPENDGIGFASMYDRAEIIGAKLDVVSETGRGTTITLEVPLEKSRQKA
ncbi:MAG: PAS domain S-box protein [Acidobacteria bacterium]|nr:PAS domain S-box protein [Acidobacteriota bacterium]